MRLDIVHGLLECFVRTKVKPAGFGCRRKVDVMHAVGEKCAYWVFCLPVDSWASALAIVVCRTVPGQTYADLLTNDDNCGSTLHVADSEYGENLYSCGYPEGDGCYNAEAAMQELCECNRFTSKCPATTY